MGVNKSGCPYDENDAVTGTNSCRLLPDKFLSNTLGWWSKSLCRGRSPTMDFFGIVARTNLLLSLILWLILHIGVGQYSSAFGDYQSAHSRQKRILTLGCSFSKRFDTTTTSIRLRALPNSLAFHDNWAAYWRYDGRGHISMRSLPRRLNVPLIRAYSSNENEAPCIVIYWIYKTGLCSSLSLSTQRIHQSNSSEHHINSFSSSIISPSTKSTLQFFVSIMSHLQIPFISELDQHYSPRQSIDSRRSSVEPTHSDTTISSQPHLHQPIIAVLDKHYSPRPSISEDDMKSASVAAPGNNSSRSQLHLPLLSNLDAYYAPRPSAEEHRTSIMDPSPNPATTSAHISPMKKQRPTFIDSIDRKSVV